MPCTHFAWRSEPIKDPKGTIPKQALASSAPASVAACRTMVWMTAVRSLAVQVFIVEPLFQVPMAYGILQQLKSDWKSCSDLLVAVQLSGVHMGSYPQPRVVMPHNFCHKLSAASVSGVSRQTPEVRTQLVPEVLRSHPSTEVGRIAMPKKVHFLHTAGCRW